MDIRPLHQLAPDTIANFVGEVRGFDASGDIYPDQVSEIERAMDQYAVLVFRDQHLDDRSHVAFGRHFGELEITNKKVQYSLRRKLINLAKSADKLEWLKKRLKPSAPSGGVTDFISNVFVDPVIPRDDPGRSIQLRNQLWHTDSSFKPIPAKYSLLYARSLPASGGDTEFADMRAAWDTLGVADQKAVFDLVCLHSEDYSCAVLGFSLNALIPVIRNRLVRRHPVTGRYNLYLASHAGAIEGMPIPEARLLLRELTEHATQRQFVYRHKWQANDMVMWDNRVTMHRGRRYKREEVRDLHRVTVADVAPTLEQPL